MHVDFQIVFVRISDYVFQVVQRNSARTMRCDADPSGVRSPSVREGNVALADARASDTLRQGFHILQIDLRITFNESPLLWIHCGLKTRARIRAPKQRDP